MKDYQPGEWLTELTAAQIKGLEKLVQYKSEHQKKDLPPNILTAIDWAHWVVYEWRHLPRLYQDTLPTQRKCPHLPDPRQIVQKKGKDCAELDMIKNSYCEYFSHGFGLIACLHIDRIKAEMAWKFYRIIYKKMYGEYPYPGRSGLNMLLVR